MTSQTPRWLVSLTVFATLFAPAQQPDAPIPSPHRAGPNGMEAWTLNYPADEPNGESYPGTLVLARHGHILRQIDGNPLIWNYIFVNNGKRIAYETGPLHFSMSCILADVPTGRRLAALDCFHGLKRSAPAWARALEAAPQPTPPTD